MSPATALVVGLGVTGRAVTRHLVATGWRVLVVEDAPTATTPDEVTALGATLVPASAAAGVDLVVPNPGVRPGHPAVAAALGAGVPVRGEIERAWELAGGRPVVAVTGTNGKTTVCTLVAAMLVASGRPAVAAGNIGLPLIEAVATDVAVVVAEVSSFQLFWTRRFRPSVAVWLNLAEDHLDWHPDMAHYADAKARVWANQGSGDVAVINAEDDGVTRAAATAPAQVRVVGFGLGSGDYHLADGMLRGPDGDICAVADVARSQPHDLANALAAVAAARAAGADIAACAGVLAGFTGLPHRVELVARCEGVSWYDDSKATTPASVVAALAGFDSAVLIAGGRNKGLDLRTLRSTAVHLRAVVAIGEAAPAVIAAFAGAVPVETARSMSAAVALARRAARPGDAVLLSPGCASFDWYRSYAERGDDFASCVREMCRS
ncbi:MAG: UDP-N-acetylmuramoyl-L-alanine--D-glutamate ligase [Acidimicrobiales bacterium]